MVDLREHLHRPPHVDVPIELETGKIQRHHTDDGEWHHIELNCPADHRWIRTEAPLPKRVADYDYGLRIVSAVIRGCKRAPDERRHAEHLKKAARDRLRVHLFGINPKPGRRQVPLRHPSLRCRKSRAQWRALTEPLVKSIRKPLISEGRLAGRHAHQSFRLREVQRSKHECVDDREDRRVRSDAERERKDGYCGEAGVLQQLAEGVPKVIKHSKWAPSKFRWMVESSDWALDSRSSKHNSGNA